MIGPLEIVAMVSLGIAILSAVVIALDIALGHRQKMWIMNLVWPITALYSGPLGLLFYFIVGRRSAVSSTTHSEHHSGMHHGSENSMPIATALAATHCGSGCTLGDIVAEWLILVIPFSIFGVNLFGDWALDYAFAFTFGIVFQYFTIAPMQGLSLRDGLIAAFKADSLSLTSWQVGMYGWMAISVFVIFGQGLQKTDPVFWFMMQIAMLVGFATAYPTNWCLLRAGIKEKM